MSADLSTAEREEEEVEFTTSLDVEPYQDERRRIKPCSPKCVQRFSAYAARIWIVEDTTLTWELQEEVLELQMLRARHTLYGPSSSCLLVSDLSRLDEGAACCVPVYRRNTVPRRSCDHRLIGPAPAHRRHRRIRCAQR